MTKWEILSLGGSLVCPNKVDIKFLNNFKKFITKWIKKGKKFVIFVGGGKLAREYQRIAKKLGIKKKEDLDWIGIFATLLNAILVKSFFGKLTPKKFIIDLNLKIPLNNKVIIFGGWKPGCSTDFDAVFIAKKLKAKRVINLSNISLVYDKDPKKFKKAKPLEKISFDELFKIIGKKWMPGANLPFDPIAANLAKKEKIKIIILNGKNFKNLDKFFKGQKFTGTVIE